MSHNDYFEGNEEGSGCVWGCAILLIIFATGYLAAILDFVRRFR